MKKEKENEYTMGLKMPIELHDSASKSAKEKGITLAGWIRMAMNEKLQREEKMAGADEPVTRAELERTIANLLVKIGN